MRRSEDWVRSDMTEFRTDGRGLLLDLMETSAAISQQRLDGLTDAEYLWEPVTPCWSVRPRRDVEEGGSGPSEYVLETGARGEEVLTTIAWRIGHLTTAFAARWEWSFGSRSVPPDEVAQVVVTADEGQERLWHWYGRWHDGIAAMDESDFVAVGYSQMPDGLDPTVPFASVVWWQGREMVHHLAEVALIRDLYAARS